MTELKPKQDSTKYTQVIDRELSNLKARVKDLSSLMEISIIINSTLDLDELIGLVMEKAQTVMKAEASSVMIIDEEKNILICPVALGEVGEKIKKIEIPIDKGIAGWVATHGESQIIPDAYKDPRFNPKIDKETGFLTKSILAAPLKIKDKTIGIAEVINRVDGEAFDEEDLKLFSTFCRQVAMAVENARIHQLELEKQKIEQQLEAAKFIQQSFMPEGYPASPDQPFEVAATSIAATSVGGDFYDFIQFNNDNVGFAIGDVSGKGIPAALYMARIVSDFRIHTQLTNNPGKVLNNLNKILVDRSRRGMFVTSLYGILNSATRTFNFSNAGHLPLILVQNNGQNVKLIDGPRGIPLGVVTDFNYEQENIKLNAGDSIILISDGVIEAMSRDEEMFSIQRLVNILSNPSVSAQSTVDSILQNVQNFTHGAVQHDDLTILVIRWL